MRIRSIPGSIFALMITLVLWGTATIYAQTSSTTPVQAGVTLRDALQKKAEELQKIQDQKNAVQKNLDTVLESKNSLSRELKVINLNFNQLDLSIKSSRLNIDKLSDEITLLNDEIASLTDQIANQNSTTGKLLIELQQRDHEDLVAVFLRNDQLSDAISELRTVTSLSSVLAKSMEQLRSLQDQMAAKVANARSKKNTKQQEQVDLINQQYIVKDQKNEQQRLLAETQNKESVYQQQLSQLEKLQSDVSAEVEKIESVLRKNIDPNLLPIARKGLFLWPLTGGHITQGYGSTPFALRHYRGKFHNGVDISGVPLGSPILAAESGTVINSGDQDKYCYKAGYGKFVEIKHGNGLSTLYGHLSRYIVITGEHVERGQIIGFMGHTGYATGPHLHFTVFANQTLSPARPGVSEGATLGTGCGAMPVGGHIDPTIYL